MVDVSYCHICTPGRSLARSGGVTGAIFARLAEILSTGSPSLTVRWRESRAEKQTRTASASIAVV